MGARSESVRLKRNSVVSKCNIFARASVFVHGVRVTTTRSVGTVEQVDTRTARLKIADAARQCCFAAARREKFLSGGKTAWWWRKPQEAYYINRPSMKHSFLIPAIPVEVFASKIIYLIWVLVSEFIKLNRDFWKFQKYKYFVDFCAVKEKSIGATYIMKSNISGYFLSHIWVFQVTTPILCFTHHIIHFRGGVIIFHMHINVFAITKTSFIYMQYYCNSVKHKT